MNFEYNSLFEELDQLGRELNAYISHQQKRVVKETEIEYH